MKRLLFILPLFLTVSLAHGFDIQLTPDKVLNGTGQNIDTPAFFRADLATESLLFVTGKGNGVVEVWKYSYDTQFSTMNISGTPNGVAVHENRLYVGIYGSNPRIEVYELPDLAYVRTIGEGIIANGETNLDVLHLTNGETRVYVSDDTPRVLGFNVLTGNLQVYVSLSPFFQHVETVLCDEFHQIVFIPDEDGVTGIHYFSPNGQHLGSFGAGDFQSDAEGITLYDAGNGKGYVIVSDQKNPLSEFEFYDRETFDHVGVLKLAGVNNTDGIALTQQPSALFPAGVFAAIDDDATTALISWQTVLDEIGPVTAVKGNAPSVGALSQNYPNPFNPSTTIEYFVPKTGHAKLVVYNTLGQEISTIVDEVRNAGTHRVAFDGLGLCSGMYFYKLETGASIATRKMLLIK